MKIKLLNSWLRQVSLKVARKKDGVHQVDY